MLFLTRLNRISDKTVLLYWLSCLFSPQSTPCNVRWRRGNGCIRSSREFCWNFFVFRRHWPAFSLTGNPENKDGAIQNGVKQFDWGHARMQSGWSENQKIAAGASSVSPHTFSFHGYCNIVICAKKNESRVYNYCVSQGWGMKLKHFGKYLISEIFISEISQNETKSNRKWAFYPVPV